MQRQYFQGLVVPVPKKGGLKWGTRKEIEDTWENLYSSGGAVSPKLARSSLVDVMESKASGWIYSSN